MSETTAIKSETRELADKLKNGMAIDDNGIITTEKDLFQSTLPEDLDMKTVNRVFDHTAELTSAMVLATGELGEDALKKNKKLDTVSSNLKMSRHGEITTKYDRRIERTVRNPQDPNAKPRQVVQWGVTTPRIKLSASKNSGDLKKVRQTVMENAEKAFG